MSTLEKHPPFAKSYKEFLESSLPDSSAVDNNLLAFPDTVELCDYESCMIKTNDQMLLQYSVDFNAKTLWRHPKMEWTLKNEATKLGVLTLVAYGTCPCCGFQTAMPSFHLSESYVADFRLEEYKRVQTAFKEWQSKPKSKLGQEAMAGYITDVKLSKGTIFKGGEPTPWLNTAPSSAQMSDMVATLASVSANLANTMANMAQAFDTLAMSVKSLANTVGMSGNPYLVEESKKLILQAQNSSVSPSTFLQLQSIAKQVHSDLTKMKGGGYESTMPHQINKEVWGKAWVAGSGVKFGGDPFEHNPQVHKLLTEKEESVHDNAFIKEMVKQLKEETLMKVLKAKEKSAQEEMEVEKKKVGIGTIHITTGSQTYSFDEFMNPKEYFKPWKGSKEKIPPPQPLGPPPKGGGKAKKKW